MINKLFVGGLSYDTTDQTLADHFSKAGQVLSAKVITDRYTGKGKGFGFVEMSTVEEAEKAMHELNGSQLDGRSIVVKEAKPQTDRNDRSNDNRGGNGGGGGNSYQRRNRY